MTTTGSQPIRLASLLSLLFFGAIAVSYADIKVGSYAWQHRYDGNVSGLPTANIYGGGYGHLDIAWTWTIEDGMQRVNQDWTTAANCLDDNPTWYAGHSGMQSANYLLRKMYPATWARIKALSDAGRYDGSELGWAEGYWDFGGDEYYLRNYYISYRFCQDNFGYAPLVASGYDLDAPCWTQPKIQTYVTGRTAENPTGVGFANRCGYNNEDIWAPNNWPNFRWTSDDGSMVIVGVGGNFIGDGGGAEACVGSAGRFPTFASKVFKENNWNTSVPNLWNGSLIHTAGSGYSAFWTGAKVCENRLLEAEKFATFARPYGYVYPLHGDNYLYDVWGGFLKFNQHDIADGQGTPGVVVMSNPTNMNLQDAYASALTVADTTLRRALSVISADVNTAGGGTSVIIYNALSWTRTDYAMVRTSDLGLSAPLSVRDASGAVVPSQVMSDGGVTKLVFTAENVPSLGFKEYKVTNSTATVTAGVTALDGSVIQLDNQYCTVKINKANGAVTSIYDKTNSKELLGGPGNRIASNSNPDGNNNHWWEWCCGLYAHNNPEMPATLTYLSPSSVTLMDSGPAVARVKITYTDAAVNWDQYLMLFSKVPVVGNKMATSNLGIAELIVNLPLDPSISNTGSEHNAGVAYGHQTYAKGNGTRIFVPGSSPVIDFMCMTPVTHKWANVTSDAKDYSVALLENNCSPWSFYGIGGAHDLRMLLVSNRYYGNNGRAWEMSWGIWGHTGDWTDGAAQKGYEFNSPLIARVEAAHAGHLPKEFSFLTVEPENIIVTAVKKWESESPTQKDSLTMQVRFYEIDGKNTDAVFKFPASPPVKAWESMGNEYGIYGGQIPATSDGGMQKVIFTTGHNQIRSLKVQTPYVAASTGRNGFRAPTPALKSDAGMTARIYNTKGQMIWRGPGCAALSGSKARRATPAGLYLAQFRTREGTVVETRKLCGEIGGSHK